MVIHGDHLGLALLGEFGRKPDNPFLANKVHRDIILGHILQGMDAHYMAPSIDDLHRAMARYTEWLDGQMLIVNQNRNKT